MRTRAAVLTPIPGIEVRTPARESTESRVCWAHRAGRQPQTVLTHRSSTDGQHPRYDETYPRLGGGLSLLAVPRCHQAQLHHPGDHVRLGA